MKKTVVMVLLLFLSTSLILPQSNNFSYKPEKPGQGELITISYIPVEALFTNTSNLIAVALPFGKFVDNKIEIPMTLEENKWIANVTIPDSTLGIFLFFSDGENRDMNNGNGYIVHLYGKDGNYIPGTFAGLATAYSSWISIIDLDPDQEKAFQLFEKEFAINPNAKRDFLNYYLSSIFNIDKEYGKTRILEELSEINLQENLTEDTYSLLINWYDRLKESGISAKLKKIVNEKYPNGQYAQMQKFMTFRQIKELDQKVQAAEEYFNVYPNGYYTTNIGYDLIRSYTQAEKFIDANNFLTSKFTNATASNYNSLAWAMSQKDDNLELALDIAQKGIEVGRAQLKNQSQPKPPYYSENEWLKSGKVSLAMVLDTYGIIATKLGKKESALTAFEEAVTLSDKSEPELNENYSASLIENGNFRKAIFNLEEFISSGHSTAKMKELLKEAFVRINITDEGFDKYYSKFEEAAKKKIMAKLEKEIINEPAPQFSLIDLEGKEISLSDFKGKSVIVDFWATWCGPCLASFPGMKTAVEKFENSGQAKFLFVNTWENVENKKQNAADFIVKNKYPFQVLMDEKNEVIASYKVSGIPTKFIIDKNGNVRFKSVGFNGNADEMVYEIGLMLEMIQ